MKKISIIGTGRLGLAFALLCEQAGYEVMGCDKREDYVERLNNKDFTTPEPQIETLLKRSTGFTATTNIQEAIEFSDLLFVFVPTPSKENGEYDHQYIEEVYDDLMKAKDISGKTLIINCTTMPGYCQELQDRLYSFGIDVVYNPEFIAQGNIINGLIESEIVLFGSDVSISRDVFVLYEYIMTKSPNIKALTLTAAEITKVAINCFLTTKISFANLIAEIAINSGQELSVKDILSTIGSDSRIGNKYLNYGFGFGGVCLPRDNRALGIHAEKVGVKANVPKEVDAFNNQHLYFLKEKIMQENPDKEVPFIFNQLSYKKGVDILTESQHYKLCMELLEEGYKVNIAESEVIIELIKPLLEKYGDRVTYGNGIGNASDHPERVIAGQQKIGYLINL